MTEIQLLDTLGTSSWSVDVLFVTNQPEIPVKIHRLLESKNLSWATVKADKLSDKLDELTNVGALVADTSELTMPAERDKFLKALAKIERANTGIILLNDHIGFPFEEFRLAHSLNSASPEELWGRIESTVAYRKNFTTTAEPKPQPDTTELNSDMTSQLKMAGQVQRLFLPKQLANNDKLHWATIFQPADWVSGDIYDVARLDERHIGFYIADAVGHSMPAALLTMFLKQAIVMRQTLQNDYRIFSPSEVIKNLNTKMIEQDLGGSLFITCCYCLLDIRSLQLTFARGGHPYPVLIKKDQWPVQLENRGALVGVFADAQFDQQSIQLEPGDKLFIYSDGCEGLVGESQMNSQFIFTSTFRSLARLSIERMMAEFELLTKNRHTQPGEADDVTVIGLEIL